MAIEANSNTTQQVLAKEGKYLTFALREEEFGVEIHLIREIIKLMEITAVPQVPGYVKGVINLRGKVIPVIDLRLKFGIEKTDYTNETCIIVLDIEGVYIGIIVDHVCEVLEVAKQDIDPPPMFGSGIRTDFILGMGKVGEKVKMLLNIKKVLMEDVALSQKIGK